MKRIIIEGTIQGNEKGYGFLIPSDPKYNDFFIPHSDLKGAMHKDLVLAEVVCNKERTVGRVLKILERGIYEVVGVYTSTKNGGFVRPDDKKYFCDIFIPSGKGVRAKTGDKVVCKIFAFPNRKCPEGIVKEVLGKCFTKQAELKSIERNYGLEREYPFKAVQSIKDLQLPSENEINGRVDYRNIVTMTIDGEDSRDFDDAASISKNKDGSYLLGVHIADVTHYVKEGGAIDVEAFKRGTSVYFPQSVIPMLPEKLCNDLCSLVEGEDRLTISCIMHIDKNANVFDYKIQKSVINSKARLTYNQVQSIIDGDKNTIKRLSKVVSDIYLMNELCDVLTLSREKSGYVNLDVKESMVTVDENCKISVQPTIRDKAHKIIEEFMILANVCVATHLFNNKIPCIYRVHDKPDEEKYKFFLSFLDGIGVKTNYKESLSTMDYQQILESTISHPAFNVINRLMLRSMQKAKYSEECKMHFGLGEEFYCHFTSPIRRYPDLYVHRILKDSLDRGIDFVNKKYSSVVGGVAKKSSEKERNAMEAERATDDYYKMLYISDFVGQKFDGIISGVTQFGVFVELDNGIEGLVKIETIEGGNYQFDPKRILLTNGINTYKLGNEVTISVAGVNVCDRKAEFIFV